MKIWLSLSFLLPVFKERAQIYTNKAQSRSTIVDKSSQDTAWKKYLPPIEYNLSSPHFSYFTYPPPPPVQCCYHVKTYTKPVSTLIRGWDTYWQKSCFSFLGKFMYQFLLKSVPLSKMSQPFCPWWFIK